MKNMKSNPFRLNQCLRLFGASAGKTLRIAFCLLLLFSAFTACRDKEVHCRVVRVEEGYGYIILQGRDTLIVQPYVPAVGGRMPFATRRHAQAVGELVCRKLMAGDSPSVSRDDVEALR